MWWMYRVCEVGGWELFGCGYDWRVDSYRNYVSRGRFEWTRRDGGILWVLMCVWCLLIGYVDNWNIDIEIVFLYCDGVVICVYFFCVVCV